MTSSPVVNVGSEFLVNTQAAGDQETPAITGLSNGNFVVTWADWSALGDDNSYTGVMAQIFTADGTKVGSEFLVNTETDNYQLDPTVTNLSNGDFVVTWTDWSSAAYTNGISGSSIKAQIFAPDGTKVGSEFLVNTQTTYESNSTITNLGDGGFVVTWTDWGAVSNTSESNVKAQIFSADGGKVGSEFLVNTQTENDRRFPTISTLADGNFVITWTDGTIEGATEVKAQIFSDDGTKVGSELLVNTPTTNTEAGSTVVPLSNGSFVILWYDVSGTLQFPTGQSMKAQVFSADGTKIGSELLIDPQDSDGTGAITSLSNGDFVVTTFGGAPQEQLFSADGTKIGNGSYELTVLGGYNITSAALGNGSFVVAWTNFNDSTMNDFDIHAQIFAVDTTPPVVTVSGYAIDKNSLPTVTVNGTTEANASVSIYDGTTLVDTVTAGADGSWSLSGVTLAEGANSLSATATDTAGNIGTSGVIAAPTVISAGTAETVSSTMTDYIVYNTGVLNIDTGTNASGDILIGSGGIVNDYGSTDDVTVQSGGVAHVYFGGSADQMTVEAGGYADVLYSSISNTTLNGYLQVLDGGTATGTTIGNGGAAVIQTGGTANGSTVDAGGLQYVTSGATATGTDIAGGTETVTGTSTNATIESGGSQHVLGGSASNATIEAGGYQDVSSATVTDTQLYGFQQVLAGGTANGTTIDNGGAAIVQAGGLANNTHIINGTDYVKTGGVQNGIDFSGGTGALLLDDASGLTGTISNFEVGDSIDLLNESVSSFGFDGTTLTLATSGGNVAYNFTSKQANTTFQVAGDGHGGTQISLSLISQLSASLVPDGGLESSFVTQDTTTTVNPLTHA